MPKKRSSKKSNQEEPDKARKPPTTKWQEMATRRGYDTVSEITDDLLLQVLVSWSEDDIRRAVPFLWGVLQGLSLQLGRLESVLAHSGHAPPQVLRHICATKITEAYSIVCNMMEHEKGGDVVPRSLKELIKIVNQSSVVPHKRSPPKQKTAENVIQLPVFRKKE